MPQCTRSLACENRKHTSKSTTGSPEIPGLPCAMVLTVSFVVPGDRAFLSPSPRNAKHCRELISASRYQDRTTSPSAFGAFVACAISVHRIPRPTFVTIAIRPSFAGRGTGEVIEMICPTGRAEYFCAEDWTLKSALIALEEFDFWRNESLLGSHPFRHFRGAQVARPGKADKSTTMQANVTGYRPISQPARRRCSAPIGPATNSRNAEAAFGLFDRAAIEAE